MDPNNCFIAWSTGPDTCTDWIGDPLPSLRDPRPHPRTQPTAHSRGRSAYAPARVHVEYVVFLYEKGSLHAHARGRALHGGSKRVELDRRDPKGVFTKSALPSNVTVPTPGMPVGTGILKVITVNTGSAVLFGVSACWNSKVTSGVACEPPLLSTSTNKPSGSIWYTSEHVLAPFLHLVCKYVFFGFQGSVSFIASNSSEDSMCTLQSQRGLSTWPLHLRWQDIGWHHSHTA